MLVLIPPRAKLLWGRGETYKGTSAFLDAIESKRGGYCGRKVNQLQEKDLGLHIRELPNLPRKLPQ